MRVCGNGRGRKAVLSALAAVGDQGMTLFALGVAVDLPEPDLQALLNRLVLSGHVRCVGDAGMAAVGSGRALYRLARRPVFYIPAQRRAV
jgi:DNA-binding IclR family transcriptional regulator